MGEIDRRAIAAGPFDGVALMRRAGAAATDLALTRFGGAERFVVLCGPGNNGGDGYVIADLLGARGAVVAVFATAEPRAGSDAATVRAAYGGAVRPLSEFVAAAGDVVVDALFGAGLDRDVPDDVRRAIDATRGADLPVLAIDLPSGISGDTGAVMGAAFRAAVTVTFVRPKPGHLLYPGRAHCGELHVVDIGIGDEVVASIGSALRENRPALWLGRWPDTGVDAHKYSRGHVAVVSGGPAATGAARMSAAGAARAGAGAVTLLSPGNALIVNASHLTSTILRRSDTIDDILVFVAAKRPASLVYGPGLEPDAAAAAGLVALLKAAAGLAIVADAGAITASAADPQPLFDAAGAGEPRLVLTPHDGEFARLFPDLSGLPSKVERVRAAARRATAVVIGKGPDTVIAAPDGRSAININGTPLLATAGSGDVLGGLVAGLAAQRMPLFEAACAAVWLHAEAARAFGPGVIAEDLPNTLPAVLRKLAESRSGAG